MDHLRAGVLVLAGTRESDGQCLALRVLPHQIDRGVTHQRTPDPKQGFSRFKVGDAEVTALYDGIWEKVHDPAYFSNATVQETKQALAAAGLTTAFVTIPITSSTIRSKSARLMMPLCACVYRVGTTRFSAGTPPLQTM